MKTKNKLLCLGMGLVMSGSLLLTGCHTVQGAFHGAGQDVNSVVTAVQPEHHYHHRHHVAHKKVMTTTTTTNTMSTAPANPVPATTYAVPATPAH